MTHYPSPGSCRDGDIVEIGGVYYKCHTNGYPSGVFTDCNEFGIAKSTDGVYWTQCARISMADVETGTQRRTWSPCWVLDSNGKLYIDGSGNAWITITTNSDNWTAASQVYAVPMSGTDFGTRGTPQQLTGAALPSWLIGATVIQRNDGSWLFGVEEVLSGGTSAAMLFYTASALTGPYSLLLDASSWGDKEGGTMIRLPSGSLRVFYNDLNTPGCAFRDSADDGATWSAETKVVGDGTFTVPNVGPLMLVSSEPRPIPYYIIRANGLRGLKLLIKAQHPTVKIPGLDGRVGYFR